MSARVLPYMPSVCDCVTQVTPLLVGHVVSATQPEFITCRDHADDCHTDSAEVATTACAP